MADITLDTLHADLTALRGDLIRLEAKIDGKPSLMAMFTAVVIVVFGMTGIIGTTIAVLANLHGFADARMNPDR